VVWLLGCQNKTAGEVQLSGGNKWVVGPQLHLPVAGSAGESQAFVNQLASEPMASGGRVDKQDPQLGGRVVHGDAEHAPDAGPVQLSDPSGLAYSHSLTEPDGPWAGFARQTVEDWLGVLATGQPPKRRRSAAGAAERSLALAVLRGSRLDLLATDDLDRTTAAVRRHLAQSTPTSS
jgi:hypothetical protein